jgi:hypothetical protein
MSRFVDHDSTHFDFGNTIKWLFMISDIGLMTPHPSGIGDGEVAVLDFNGFTWWHLMKVAGNLTVLKAFLKYVQEAVPYKVVQNHYLNCSPVLSKLMILIRPFVKKELFESMHFHANYESLYKFIPKEMLPVEYGGSSETVNELYARCLKVVETGKDYVKNEDNWKISRN